MTSVDKDALRRSRLIGGAERRHPRRRIAAGVAVLAILGLVALVVPRSAYANYSVQECVTSANIGAPDPFQVRPFGDATKIKQSAECYGGGWGLRMDANGQSNHSTWVAWQVNAPPNTNFKLAYSTVHYYATGGYGTMTSGSGAPGYSSVGTGAPPDHWVTPIQNDTTWYAIVEQCFASPCSSTAAFAYVNNFYAEVQDFAPPTVSASGELLDGGTVRGVQTLQAAVNDRGGGARMLRVFVNGVLSTQDEVCAPTYNGSYTAVKPCADSSGSRALALDTEHGPGWVNGPNDVQICGYDAAMNQSPCVRRTVQVDNTCPSSGAQAAASLSSGVEVGGQLRSQAAVRSTDSPVIRGRLTTASGTPVEGGTVCVYETIDLADASRQMAAKATSQANGRFAVKLDAGASRRVDVVYRYNTKTLEKAADLVSTVVPTLRLNRKSLANGQSIHFLGRLPGPNADGRAVALQARVGRKWRTFKQLRTDSDGSFRGKYRFTQTFGRQRYVFRALVKRQGGYPYEPGTSVKRKLVVRG
jgi:5-hydroxyisourate hydrolase-like protein (transthyretin family)